VDCLNGSDGNDGLNPSSAWQTIQRVNQAVLGPGDSILLKRGCTWQGTGFKANGSGSVALPITLADYGDARLPLPVIDGVGAHESAVLLQNVQNWIVRNLELTQHGKRRRTSIRTTIRERTRIRIPMSICGRWCTCWDLARKMIRIAARLARFGTSGWKSGSARWKLDRDLCERRLLQLKTVRYGVVDNLVIAGVESRNNHKAGIDITCTYYQTHIYARAM